MPTQATDPYNVPKLPAEAVLYDAAVSGDVTYSQAGGVSLWVSATGDATVTPLGSTADIVLTALPAYTLLPFRVVAIKAATTANFVVLS